MLFAFGLLLRVTFNTYGPSFLDFGFEVNTATRISNGEIPYRDFFTLINPFHFILTGALLSIFGQNTDVLFLFAATVGSLISVLAFMVIYRFTNWVWGVVAWLSLTAVSQLTTGVVPNYSFTSSLFFILTVLILSLHFFKNKGFSRFLIFLAGTSAALTFWSKQTIGVYLMCGFLFFVFLFWNDKRIRNKRFWAWFLAGHLFIDLLFICFIIVRGATSGWINDTLLIGLRFSGEAKINPPLLFTGEATSLVRLAFNVLVIVIVFEVMRFTYLRIKKHSSETTMIEFYIFILGLALFFITNERFSPLKLAVGSQLLVLYLVLRTANTRKLRRYLYLATLLVIVILNILMISSRAGSSQKYIQYKSTKGNLLLTPADHQRLTYAVDFIERNHKKSILVLPSSPVYYYFGGINNPTRFDLVIPGNLSNADKHELIANMRCAIDYIIFDESWAFDGKQFKNYNSTIHKTMLDNYSLSENGPGTLNIYKRFQPKVCD